MCRGRYECCKALLRAGADPNFINKGGDLTLFWSIDGGIEIIKLMHQYGVNMDTRRVSLLCMAHSSVWKGSVYLLNRYLQMLLF